MQFSRYHGTENSFLITTYEKKKDYQEIAKELCRGTNYNTDGLLIVKSNPLEMVIYNRDGSEASMCGNGIRCFVHYCYDKFKMNNFSKIKTKAGYYDCKINSIKPFIVTVNLGLPTYINNIVKKSVIIKNNLYEISTLLLGVLHTIVIVNNYENLESIMQNIIEYNIFNSHSNFDFVRIINHKTIEVKTFEKGVGWTQSCGTGVAASAYVMHESYNLSNNINACTAGGVINIKISDNIYLTASSEYIDDLEVMI